MSIEREGDEILMLPEVTGESVEDEELGCDPDSKNLVIEYNPYLIGASAARPKDALQRARQMVVMGVSILALARAQTGLVDFEDIVDTVKSDPVAKPLSGISVAAANLKLQSKIVVTQPPKRLRAEESFYGTKSPGS